MSSVHWDVIAIIHNCWPVCFDLYLLHYLISCFMPLAAFSTLILLVGRQEEHPACKNWVMRCWHDYLSGARCILFAYGPADATASQNLSSLRYLNSDWFYLSATGLPKLSWKRGHQTGMVIVVFYASATNPKSLQRHNVVDLCVCLYVHANWGILGLLHLLLENCDFLNIDISQGSVATGLGCGGVFKYDCYKFLTESNSERILKIG